MALNREALAALEKGGMERAAAELALFDYLQETDDPDVAIEGFVILLRVADRTGRLGPLCREVLDTASSKTDE